MQTNIHNKQQNHDPYARNHPTAIVIYKSKNQDKNHNEGTMQFLASATLGAVTGNGIARYDKINRPIRFKHDAMPILAGTAIPTIISVAGGLQPTGLKLLGAGVTSAIIAYSMTPNDQVAEDKKTDNEKADAPKPVPTDSNNQPQATPISTDNQPQAIPTSPQTTTQNNTQNNTQKSLSEQAVDFFSNLFAPKQPKPKKETKPVPLTAHQKELQEIEERRIKREARGKQQAEARARRRAYEQTDAYKEEQRLEAEAEKRKEAEDAEESRRASRLFDQRMLEYIAERNRRSQRHQIPSRPMYNVQRLLDQITTPRRRAEVNNAIEILKPYLKEKTNTIQEIIQKVLPHNSVTSEQDFDKTQSKNARTLQNVYHPNKINNLSVPPEKQAEIAKQLEVISTFITNLRNLTYHFKLRDQVE